MTRVHVIVEGTTEASFVGNVLAPTLWVHAVYLNPIILGVPGHKGGRTNYARVRKDVLKQLKQDRTSLCTTMLDLYGLGEGFPGMPTPAGLDNLARVRHIEKAVKADIVAEIPDARPDVRFLPYLQLHEYEALLFSDPVAFAGGIYQPHLSAAFQEIRNAFPTPEDIDDHPESAPSKRVIAAYPPYGKAKPLQGVLAALQVGIESMTRECPHFREWFDQLMALGGSIAAAPMGAKKIALNDQ